MTDRMREFALKLAEGALDEYRSYLRDHAQVSEHFLFASEEDCQAAKHATMTEVSDALETYGIVAGYPSLLAAAQELVTLWQSARAPRPDELAAAYAALDKAITVSTTDVYLPGYESPQTDNVSDIPLPF